MEKFTFDDNVCNVRYRIMLPMDEYASNTCNDTDWSTVAVENPPSEFHKQLFCDLYNAKNIHACEIVEEGQTFDTCTKKWLDPATC